MAGICEMRGRLGFKYTMVFLRQYPAIARTMWMGLLASGQLRGRFTVGYRSGLPMGVDWAGGGVDGVRGIIFFGESERTWLKLVA